MGLEIKINLKKYWPKFNGKYASLDPSRKMNPQDKGNEEDHTTTH
jgi:hypothetical protein